MDSSSPSEGPPAKPALFRFRTPELQREQAEMKELAKQQKEAAKQTKKEEEDAKREFELLVHNHMIQMLREKDPPETRQGWPAVKKIWKDLYNKDRENKMSWEAEMIARNFFYGGFAGFLWGGTIRSWGASQEFVRRFNECTFEGKTDLRKRIHDYQVAMMGKNGISFGWRTALMGGTLTSLFISSLAYHNDIHVIDISLLTGAAFGVTRFHLGIRAMMAAGTIGIILGSLVGGILKLSFFISGDTINSWREQNELEYFNEKLKIREEARAYVVDAYPIYRPLMEMDEQFKLRGAVLARQQKEQEQEQEQLKNQAESKENSSQAPQSVQLPSPSESITSSPASKTSWSSYLTKFLPSVTRTTSDKG